MRNQLGRGGGNNPYPWYVLSPFGNLSHTSILYYMYSGTDKYLKSMRKSNIMYQEKLKHDPVILIDVDSNEPENPPEEQPPQDDPEPPFVEPDPQLLFD